MSEYLVQATVIPADGEDWEAEAILVKTEANTAVLILDDGTQFVVDRRELVEALCGMPMAEAA